MNHFEIKTRAKNTSARTAILRTAHGEVQTPVFMPVGTRGTVKGILPAMLLECECQMILANTYHLLLRPGVETIKNLGGLHNLTAWHGPMLTDSGGYQVFSLAELNRIGDDGVEFASHIDGKKIYLDAKTATESQNILGADIIMCFDECTPWPCERAAVAKAVERTVKWAAVCKKTHGRTEQHLFGIVQGATDFDLRSSCAGELVKLDFPGYAIGGLSVGEGHENMICTVEHTAPLLPDDRPRYLMGVGMPADIIAAVRCGIDMFDCVLPTRNGRNAFAFTAAGPMRLRNSIYTDDAGPVEQNCDCHCCRNFSRAAVRHFFNVGEMLGPILLSIHNIRYFQRLTQKIRRHIETGDFDEWSAQAIIAARKLYGEEDKNKQRAEN